MVTFPTGFVAVAGFPGYFWNTEEEKLYSVKIYGALKPLKRSQLWNGSLPVPGVYGYKISRLGRKHFLTEERLKTLSKKSTVFPLFSEAYKEVDSLQDSA